jgi:hypothetical protein
MNVELDVLGPFVVDGVVREVDRRDVVAEDDTGHVHGKISSQRRFLSQQHSAAVLATPRYSTSTDDRETTAWRLED